jgi:hypothetical protein
MSLLSISLRIETDTNVDANERLKKKRLGPIRSHYETPKIKNQILERVGEEVSTASSNTTSEELGGFAPPGLGQST